MTVSRHILYIYTKTIFNLCANLHCFARVVSLLLERFSGANPPRILCAYCCSVPELGIGHRAPADQAQPCAYAPPAATPTAPWPPQAPAGVPLANKASTTISWG